MQNLLKHQVEKAYACRYIRILFLVKLTVVYRFGSQNLEHRIFIIAVIQLLIALGRPKLHSFAPLSLQLSTMS